MASSFSQEQKKKANTALKKVCGLTEKISHMIEHDVYCPEVAQQINAAMGLLKSLNMTVLKNHMLTVGIKQLGDKDKKKEKFVDELVRMRDVSQRK